MQAQLAFIHFSIHSLNNSSNFFNSRTFNYQNDTICSNDSIMKKYSRFILLKKKPLHSKREKKDESKKHVKASLTNFNV